MHTILSAFRINMYFLIVWSGRSEAAGEEEGEGKANPYISFGDLTIL